MLKNAYLLAKIGADTAENEQHFAEILPKLAGSLIELRAGPGTTTSTADAGSRRVWRSSRTTCDVLVLIF